MLFNILMLMATLTVVTASPIEPTTSVNSSFCPLCLEENFRDLPFLFRHYIEYGYNRTWSRCSSKNVVFVDDSEGCLTITITKLEDQAFRIYEKEMVRIPLSMFGKLLPDTKIIEYIDGKPLKAIFYQPEEVEEVRFTFDFCYDTVCSNEPVVPFEQDPTIGKSSCFVIVLLGAAGAVAACIFVALYLVKKHKTRNFYMVAKRESRLAVPSS